MSTPAKKPKIFVSYHNDEKRPLDKPFAQLVAFYLTKQPGLDVFCFSIPWRNIHAQEAGHTWMRYVNLFLADRDVFVLCVGGSFVIDGEYTGQMSEFKAFIGDEKTKLKDKKVVVVHLGRSPECVPKEKFCFGGQVCKSIMSPKNAIIKEEDCKLKKYGRCCCLKADDPVLPEKGKLQDSDVDNLHKKAEKVAEGIFNFLFPKVSGSHSKIPGFENEGLPQSNVYGIEKKVVEAIEKINSKEFDDDWHIITGCPLSWPKNGVHRFKENEYESYSTPFQESEAGEFKDFDDNLIRVSARYDEKPLLAFQEARPRKKLFLPLKSKDSTQRRGKLVVGVVCSGGIAPGINSVVSGIVERHWQYWKGSKETNSYDLEIRLIRGGFTGLVKDTEKFKLSKMPRPVTLNFYPEQGDEQKKQKTEKAERYMHQIKNYINLAGSLSLPTGRLDKLIAKSDTRFEILNDIIDNISNDGEDKLDILYVIGGQGALRAAHALAYMAKAKDKDIRIIGIPKAIDNDILWVWQSFGFITAVNKATEIMAQIHDEIRSQPRLAIVKTFGSDSGFIVSHVALGAGQVCKAALIPELKFSLKSLGDYIIDEFSHQMAGVLEKGDHLETNIPYGAIIMGETALPVDVEDYLTDVYDYGLSEAEIASIRRFSGSAYLYPENLEEENPKVHMRRAGIDVVVNSSQAWLKECLLKLGKNLNPDSELSIHDINEVIKNGNIDILRTDDNYKEALDKEMAAVMFGVVKQIERAQDSKAWWTTTDKYPPLMVTLDRLKTMRSLPFEAYAIIEEIQRMYEDSKKKQPDQERVPTEKEAKEIFKNKFAPGTWNVFMKSLRQRLKERLRRTLIEQACDFTNIQYYPSDQVRRQVKGTSESSLRDAGMKLVWKYIERRLKEDKEEQLKDVWVFINDPKQLIRAVPPSCQDIIYANRLAKLAVDNAMAGATDFMISQWNTEYVLVPLELVVLGRKRVPLEGIFWKSVIASTKQPANLWYEEVKNK